MNWYYHTFADFRREYINLVDVQRTQYASKKERLSTMKAQNSRQGMDDD